MPRHLTTAELVAGLDEIRQSPKDIGSLDLIAYRPEQDERVIVETGELNLEEGLAGDNWNTRWNRHHPEGIPNIEKQLNIMNARVAQLVAREKSRWALAGDQLYLDFDLSDENLKAGDQLAIGDAIIEITPPPHTGCKKFVERFGVEAMKFVNSPVGKSLHLRGICAKVIKPGTIKTGNTVRKC